MSSRWAAVLVVAGVALLLTAARHPAAAGDRRAGGILRVNLSGMDVASLDPALAYNTPSWQILAATCAKLLTYPDTSSRSGARLIPEVARSLPRASRNGRTYTFTVRTDYRFDTGGPVTPQSFVRAFERALSPRMQSPASSFVDDVVGAAAFARGKARRISGLRVTGNELTVQLTKVAPDFLARLAMPFFCAVPADLPIEPSGVDAPPMAGPYAIASRVPGRSLVLRRNPFYRGPRPHRVDRIEYTVNTSLSASFLQVRRGEADYDVAGLPAAAHTEVSRRYGVNRGRYFVHPLMSVFYLALNTSRPLFRDASVRRAVSFAVDRRTVVRLAGVGAGRPTDQILPPNVPGFRDARIYPFSPDPARARALLRGRTGKAVLYTASLPFFRDVALLVQANLAAVGIEVEIESFAAPVLRARAGTRGEPFDIEVAGWLADYPDPSNFLDVLLNGRRIQAANNVNTSYFDDPLYNRRLAAAAVLSGPVRYRTYGALDVDISRNAAPIVPLGNANAREFVSSRVGCYSFHPVWGSLNLAAVCLR